MQPTRPRLPFCHLSEQHPQANPKFLLPILVGQSNGLHCDTHISHNGETLGKQMESLQSTLLLAPSCLKHFFLNRLSLSGQSCEARFHSHLSPVTLSHNPYLNFSIPPGYLTAAFHNIPLKPFPQSTEKKKGLT